MAEVFQCGYHTESAGTAITEVVPGLSDHVPRLTCLEYKCGVTAHTITVMRCVATTTAAAGAAASQAVIEFTDIGAMKNSAGADETIAANDWVVYKTDDSVFELNSVSSVSGNDVTMNTNLSDTVDSGSPIYIFGELGRSVHKQLMGEASTVNSWNHLMIQGGIPNQIDRQNYRLGLGDPLIVHVDNITNAGALKCLSGEYVGAGNYAIT